MAKKFEWENYLIIEEDFIEAKKYISFDRTANLETDSPFLQNEIVLLGSKVESAMKKLISYYNTDTVFSPANISDYKRIILIIFPNIEMYECALLQTDLVLAPFKDWSSKKLSWWEAYSSIKHGSSRLPKLEHALNLLSAYQILLFLIQYKEQEENESICYSLDEIPKLLEIKFQKYIMPFGTFRFAFPREQIIECDDKYIISQEIVTIKEERKQKNNIVKKEDINNG